MSAPTIDTPPGNSQPGSSTGRRRRKQFVLVTTALVVLAVAVGSSLAIATRPVTRQTPAETAPAPAAAATDQTAGADTQQNADADPDQGAPAEPAAQAGSGTDPAPGGNDADAPVLPDGDTPAYITKVDAANDRIVVDVVQVFHDDEAVKAAVADGKSPSDARYLTTWVRNESSRLRTLPLADDLAVKLRDSCGEPGDDREALLTRLAANAAKKGTYYYTLTVEDGTVERIQERLAVNAC